MLPSVTRRSPTRALAAACVAALGAAGCGSSNDSYKNEPRPPAPVVVSASINDQRVMVSPERLGAGPITLVITNQSNTSQQVTLETEERPGGGPGRRAVETGPINPRETASVKADVVRGTYSLHVAGDGVRAARLVVGRERKSSQNDLLQP
jgi:hypothetical protein